MKLYKDYTKEPFSFLVNHTNVPENYCKMTFSEKIKIMENKIEQNKAQYDLDKQIAKISA